MLKKILATAIAAAMIFGLASTAFAASVPFPDISGASNADVIAKLYALGLVRGDDAGNFRPAATINRAEFATMVVRMLGLETAAGFLNTPTVFADVTAEWSWAYGYINIATGRGLIKGYEDATFRPGNPVSQAEALTMLIRALGYDDDLQGTWPTDYVMKGAELGVIESGFSGNTNATRSLVATLVDNTLDQNPVSKNPDDPDDFDEEAFTLYQDVFDLAEDADVSVEGVVTLVNTDDEEIELEDEDDPFVYVDDVVIWGKDDIEELEGQTIDAVLNDDGDICFIAVTTPSEVVGEIEDIDTVDLTVTVGATEYDVASDAVIYKNGDLLETTVSGALVDIQDADAVLLLDDDDEVYRIDASILDEAGPLDGKKTTTDEDGDVVYTLDIDGAWYEITDDTVLVRNGASAAYKDLAIGDDIEFSFKNTDELVYVDAFANVVEGYTVTEWNEDDDEVTVTTEKDDVETTFVVNEDEAATIEAAVTLGDEYDLTLNRDGEIIDVAEVEEDEFETDDAFTVASKDKYNDDGDVMYRLKFTDGSTLVLNTGIDWDNFDSATVNGIVDVDIVDDTDVNLLYAAVSTGDLFVLEFDDPAYLVHIYEPEVSGWIVHDLDDALDAGDDDGIFRVYDDEGEELARCEADWHSDVTVNGVETLFSAVEDVDADGVGTFIGTIAFSGDLMASALPEVSAVTIEKFSDVDAYPVIAIASDDDGFYTFKLGDQEDELFVEADDDTVFMLDGEEVTAADIEIGHLVKADDVDDSGVDDTANETWSNYVSAATDDDEPVVTVGATAEWDDVTETLTVTFEAAETCKYGYVYVNGEKEKATLALGVWTLEVEEMEEADVPDEVTIVVVDYAGNTSDVVTVEVDEV